MHISLCLFFVSLCLLFAFKVALKFTAQASCYFALKSKTQTSCYFACVSLSLFIVVCCKLAIIKRLRQGHFTVNSAMLFKDDVSQEKCLM